MRVPRLTIPRAFHHIRSRFVDRKWEFEHADERALYLHYLGRAFEDSDWMCVSYALMSNHVHHGWLAGEMPFGELMKRVHAPFARWMNKRRSRLGPLFADRPAIRIVRPEHIARTITYIHNNPVRGGVVAAAGDSDWTSHRAYMGAAPVPPWLRVDEGLRLIALTPDELDDQTLSSRDCMEDMAVLRKAAHMRGAIELATPTVDPLDVPLVSRPFARVRPDPRDVLAFVAEELRLPLTYFSSRVTEPGCVRARAIAVHTARRLGLVLADIASALGVSRQCASQHARRRLDRDAEDAVERVRSRLTAFTPSPLRARKHTA
jgi:putative transposase